jgi:hypothetical protein
MAYTKYSLTPANNNAAPPDGAPEGMLPSAVNDTMRDMMAQIRDVGDGIRGGTYTMTAPVITGGSINGTTVGAGTASTGAFTTLGATGVATFSAGTVSAPAITTTGDTNTGIFFPAADTIAFTEGGVESMRIDSSANVGIGTSTPSGAKLEISTGGTTNLKITSTSGNAQLILNSSGTNVGYVVYNTGGAGALAFYDSNAAAERMRITAGGVLELSQGQIQFPATQVASANANTLDDYEEGTWTPSVGGTSVTYATRTGTYIKIGRQVFLQAQIQINGGTPNNVVGNLPFTCANIDNSSNGMLVNVYLASGGITFPAGATFMTSFVIKNGTSIFLEAGGSLTASNTVTVSNTANFYIAASYISAN